MCSGPPRPDGSRQIGIWPRSIDCDGRRERLYVVHGPTVSLLNTRMLATTAEHLIGLNATDVAVDDLRT
jgi:hypothetical protein